MTAYTHLITVPQLQTLQASDAPLLVVDCSFDLADPAKADAMFAQQHIAGAVQAHLDRDLSTHSAEDAVNGGRHSLGGRRWIDRH